MIRLALATGSLGLAFISCSPSQAPEVPRREFSREERGALLPARLRRLSNAELEATMNSVLGTELHVAADLPPDIRADGYTRNSSGTVSSSWARQVRRLAGKLGPAYARRHRESLECANASDACALSFIQTFGRKALRRPIRSDEEKRLLKVFEAARAAGLDDIEAFGLVVSALLMSPSFLYQSERGQNIDVSGVTRLDHYEVASALSYMLTGAPPDERLLELADEQRLHSEQVRREQARRLISMSDTRFQFRRFVQEWLEVDQLTLTSKDETVSPAFEELKPRMLAETSAFVDEVLVNRGASISALLTGGFASVDPTMARFYGFKAWGPRVPSAESGRLGVLQQASFLASHAHPDGTSPIKRGDFVLRRLLCVEMPRPEEIGIEVTIPAVTETHTTRQRFAAHVNNEGCAACHASIDPLGFAFENFDAAGARRTTENGHPVNTQVRFEHENFAAEFQSSSDLSTWLAAQPETARCFRRHAIQFFSAGGDDAHQRAFENVNEALPVAKRQNILESLVAYAGSDLFIYRREEQ